MLRDDIATVAFGRSDVDAAFEWAEYMDRKNQGSRTVDLSKTKNVTGYLGHLAVEVYIRDMGFYCESTRTEKYRRGDQYDIKYDDDLLDVKAHRGELTQWFFNEKMLIFDHHMRKAETHYAFVMVHPEWYEAYIFGVINASDFWDKAQCGALPPRGNVGRETPYHFVLSRELRPIRNYVTRTYANMGNTSNIYGHGNSYTYGAR